MSIFRKNFVQKKLNKQIKRNARQPVFKNFDRVNSVLLLAELFDIARYEELKKVSKVFTQQGKKVDMVLFIHDKTTFDFLSTGSNAALLTEDNFSWNGKPDELVNKELKGHDLLINLNEESSLFVDYLTTLSDSGLKAGSSKHNNEVLDFMINTGERHNIQFLAEQIIFYLRSINA